MSLTSSCLYLSAEIIGMHYHAVLIVLGIELRALCILGKHCTKPQPYLKILKVYLNLELERCINGKSTCCSSIGPEFISCHLR